MSRRVEPSDDILVIPPALADPLVLPPALAAPPVLPPALAARAAVLVFGDDLLDLVLPGEVSSRWRQPGGRIFAATYLLRGRAAPGAAAAGRRRQVGAPRTELVFERLARDLTARGSGSGLLASNNSLV